MGKALMDDAACQFWLLAAEESLDAARRLRGDPLLPRSLASRAYYSCHAACHSLALHFGERPPRDRRNWPHDVLPLLLDSVLRRIDRITKERRAFYRLSIERAWSLRVSADYRCRDEFGEQGADEALRHAEILVRLAKEVLL